jgi:hypothetical protein
MKILKEVSPNTNFEIKFPKDQLLLRSLIGVGLIPNRAFKVLFKLAGGVIVIGDDTFKVALDGFTASKITVDLI